MIQRPRTSPHRHAFTLLEVITVLMVVGVLAATITPVLGVVKKSRDAGLAREVTRRLALARAAATSTGLPTGLKVDVAAQTLGLVRIASAGAPPAALPSATGDSPAASANSVAAMFPGSSITSVALSNTGSYDTIWFDYEGTPHLRNSSGVFIANLSSSVSIVVSGPTTITVRPVTGLVQ